MWKRIHPPVTEKNTVPGQSDTYGRPPFTKPWRFYHSLIILAFSAFLASCTDGSISSNGIASGFPPRPNTFSGGWHAVSVPWQFYQFGF
jgi:hypothetical protein